MLSQGRDWFLIIWALVCIVVVLGMSYWVTRFVAGKSMSYGGLARRSGNRIQILAQEMLGKEQRLVIAQVGERYFLLGVAPQNISMLAELSRDEVAQAENEGIQNVSGEPSFLNALSGAWKEKMGR